MTVAGELMCGMPAFGLDACSSMDNECAQTEKSREKGYRGCALWSMLLVGGRLLVHAGRVVTVMHDLPCLHGYLYACPSGVHGSYTCRVCTLQTVWALIGFCFKRL